MLEVFILLLVCWALASLLPRTYEDWISAKKNWNNNGRLVFFVLLVVMICFSGLRTKMNDTATYFKKFVTLPNIIGAVDYLDLSLGQNPGFVLYQILLRSLGFKSAYEFIFITSLFVTTSYILFLRKYSCDFSFSIYVFIAMCVYAFTMAAMKQTIAIAIGIWAIDAVIKQKKITKFIFLTLLASTFHPYVLIFCVVPFFTGEVWSKQTILLVVGTVAGGGMFGFVVDSVLSISESLGDSEYTEELFQDTGVSIFRLLVYLVIPILSIIFRKGLKQQKQREINIIVNMSIISACFMILAAFGGAIMFGRMACYFDLFNCLALPIIFKYGMTKNDAKIIKPIAVICFAVYYFTYYAKYGTAWNADYYRHISLFDLIRIKVG